MLWGRRGNFIWLVTVVLAGSDCKNGQLYHTPGKWPHQVLFLRHRHNAQAHTSPGHAHTQAIRPYKWQSDKTSTMEDMYWFPREARQRKGCQFISLKFSPLFSLCFFLAQKDQLSCWVAGVGERRYRVWINTSRPKTHLVCVKDLYIVPPNHQPKEMM